VIAYDAAAMGSQFSDACIPPLDLVLDELDELTFASQYPRTHTGLSTPMEAVIKQPRTTHDEREMSMMRTKRSQLCDWGKLRSNQLLDDMAPNPASKVSGMPLEAEDDRLDPLGRTLSVQREHKARESAPHRAHPGSSSSTKGRKGPVMLERWRHAASADDPYSCWTIRT
jgi:hypothetical protein